MFCRSLKLAVLVALMLGGMGQRGSIPDAGRIAQEQVAPATASLPPHVRLRKLHLVRPDLIPYPIAYEVVC
jgi:hypothetical protein